MIQGLTNIIFSSLPEVLCICQSWCYWFKSWPIICLHQPTLWPKIKTELETQKTKNQNPKKNFKSISRICILHRPRGRWALLILINLQNEIRGTQLEQKGMKAHFPSFVLCKPRWSQSPGVQSEPSIGRLTRTREYKAVQTKTTVRLHSKITWKLFRNDDVAVFVRATFPPLGFICWNIQVRF